LRKVDSKWARDGHFDAEMGAGGAVGGGAWKDGAGGPEVAVYKGGGGAGGRKFTESGLQMGGGGYFTRARWDPAEHRELSEVGRWALMFVRGGRGSVGTVS
jgi:hypothetical protein